MRKYITSLLIMFSLNLTHAQTQIQNARVKTRGRMVDGQYVPGKGLPGTVVSIEGITDIGVRNSNGTFSFPVEDNNYYVKSVAKNEYALLDSDAAPKMYNYSEDTLYFVMEQPEQMFENLLETKDKIRKTLEREWRKAMAEIKRLKEENRISQEEYLEKLEQLMSNQEKNEDLVNEMAKRYSTLDYDQLDVFYRKVNSYIEEGKLTKADSMLRSRGNVSAQIDAQLEKEESIRHREEEIAKAKSVLMHDKKELEQRCYSYFESFKMQHEYDSAAYYIEQRARLDSLNADWQYEAGTFLLKQKQYQRVEKYLLRAESLYRRLAEENPLIYEVDVALVLNALALLYRDIQRYSESEELFKESLEIMRILSVVNQQVYEPDLAILLNNLAFLYQHIRRYSESEELYKESIEIGRRLSEDNPQVYEPALALSLNNIACLYNDIQRYSESEAIHREVLAIRRRLAVANPQVYEPALAQSLNNLAFLYKDIQRYSESENLYKESIEIRRRLSEENPQVYEPALALSIDNLAFLYIDMQRYLESEALYKESIEVYRRLSAATPQVYEPNLAMSLYSLATLYQVKERYSDREELYKESLEIYRRLSVVNPEVYEPYLVMSLSALALVCFENQRYSESEALYKESIEIYRRLAVDNPHIYEDYMNACRIIASLYASQSRYVEAVLYFEEALSICKGLIKNSTEYNETYIQTLLVLKSLYMLINDMSKQYDVNEELYPIVKRIYQQDPNTSGALVTLSSTHSHCCIMMQQFSKAEKYAREGIEADSTQTIIYSKLAPSLLFQGKYNDAEKIYKQYKTELKDSFLADFEEFEKAGIIPKKYKSDVEKIKQLLNE